MVLGKRKRSLLKVPTAFTIFTSICLMLDLKNILESNISKIFTGFLACYLCCYIFKFSLGEFNLKRVGWITDFCEFI